MKVRHDFVTNSSSSSFIMAFNNNNKYASYEHFKEVCNLWGYEEFYDLINNSINNFPEDTDKKRVLEFLFNYYSYDYKLELLESELNRADYTTTNEYYIARNLLENSDEFKIKVRKYVEQNEEYTNKKKQIEDADLVVTNTIWDTNGGMLEWAIRNNFIKDNFGNNHIITWNIG